MLLTLKNKTCLAMDALIKEAKEKNGVPNDFKFSTQEASEFLKEITEMGSEKRRDIVIKQKNDNEPDTRFLLKSPLIKEMGQFLLNQWNQKEITIFYKDIEVIIFNKRPMAVVKPPEGPPNAIIKEGDTRKKCVVCGSSMWRKLFFWSDGCVQPQCKNYHVSVWY